MEDQNRIRVMLVDDHEMVRSGLSVFLAGYDNLELVGEAGDAITALEVCGEAHPDVILMDLVMPGIDGIQATRMIRGAYPHVQIIALTSFSDEGYVRQALQAGATGFLYKNASVDELAWAIAQVYEGKPALSPEAARVLLRVVTSTPSDEQNYDLTERERAVLGWMVAGLTNRQIAAKLDISPAAVKACVSSLFSKLGVSNRMEAASLAHREGLIR